MKLASAQGRWLVAAMILASGMAFLDGSIVSLALPAIERDLDAGVVGLQWTVNAYTLTLAALILVSGSLGDRLGRRRIFLVGVIWFAAASILCAAAPSIEVLVAARALQGIGGALAHARQPRDHLGVHRPRRPRPRHRHLGRTLRRHHRGRPAARRVARRHRRLAMGVLDQHPAGRSAVVVIALRHVPETKGEQSRLDFGGAGLSLAGLAFLTYGLVAQQWMPSIAGVAFLVAFVLHQRRTPHALVPLSLFTDRVFTAANICTFAIYGALSAGFLLLVLQLQYVSGYSPLEAGLATMPPTILMLLFSGRAGALGQRIGPRWPMTFGPLIMAARVRSST